MANAKSAILNTYLLEPGPPGGVLVGHWTAITVPGPALLKPQWGLETSGPVFVAQGDPAFDPRLYWTTDLALVNPQIAPEIQTAAQRAYGPGTIYFPATGDYWVCNPNPKAGVAVAYPVPAVLFDAQQYQSTVQWQTPLGVSPESAFSFTPPNTGTPALALRGGWNAFRTHFTIQNVGAQAFAVGIGTDPNTSAGTESGIVLANGERFISPCPWAYHAILSTAAGVARQCRTLEVLQ